VLNHRRAVAVPMNPMFKGREIQYYLANTEAMTLFAVPENATDAKTAARATGAQCWGVAVMRAGGSCRCERLPHSRDVADTNVNAWQQDRARTKTCTRERRRPRRRRKRYRARYTR
jgi:hypothetical protein